MLGPSHADAERSQGEKKKRKRHKPPSIATVDHAGEHIEIREADRVPHPPAFGEHVERERERHDEKRQEEERTFERHEPPPQTAPTWTTARIPCSAAVERTLARTRRPCTLCVALTAWISAGDGADCV